MKDRYDCNQKNKEGNHCEIENEIAFSRFLSALTQIYLERQFKNKHRKGVREKAYVLSNCDCLIDKLDFYITELTY